MSTLSLYAMRAYRKQLRYPLDKHTKQFSVEVIKLIDHFC